MQQFFYASGIALIILLSSTAMSSIVAVVPQAHAHVVERLGVFKEVWGPGIHLKMPFVDKVARKISLKERILDYPPQPVITKDNVTMQIDTVVFAMVTDPKLFCYGADNPLSAIEKITATTLRNIIGELELDDTLTSRELINSKMRTMLDEVSDAWGIKIVRVEVQNIMPPKDIRAAMERQMRAEREKRESILLAEGEKQAAILLAEGEKEATILKSDAAREQRVRIALGEAQAILSINEAQAKGLAMLKDAGPNELVVAIKGLESLVKVAGGRATKIIIPSELQAIAGLASSVGSVLCTPDPQASGDIDT
ncbi:MAG: SPFH/Band 7/PHB domain protein [Eubacteriaceae bacterium]|nr:SPFH/Band 7/PHB domain protein [Eubacteriaceae bacterium]